MAEENSCLQYSDIPFFDGDFAASGDDDFASSGDDVNNTGYFVDGRNGHSLPNIYGGGRASDDAVSHAGGWIPGNGQNPGLSESAESYQDPEFDRAVHQCDASSRGRWSQSEGSRNLVEYGIPDADATPAVDDSEETPSPGLPTLTTAPTVSSESSSEPAPRRRDQTHTVCHICFKVGSDKVSRNLTFTRISGFRRHQSSAIHLDALKSQTGLQLPRKYHCCKWKECTYKSTRLDHVAQHERNRGHDKPFVNSGDTSVHR